MDIQSITNSIKALFESKLTPAPLIPSALVAIGGSQRTGLSVNRSVSKIISELTKAGIPTSVGPDGTANLTASFVKIIVTEIYRALHLDASIQISMKPGDISVITTGTNQGGPMISQGVNINFGKGNAVIQ